MVCPNCGTNSAPVAGRCANCGAAAADPAAVTMLTPPPDQPVADTELSNLTGVTRPAESGSLGERDPEETRLGNDPDADAVTRAHTPGGRHTGSEGPLEIGRNFGTRYHIIRLLGIGGMGAVYQAWDQVLEVAVAIKVIRIDHSIDPVTAADLEKRFKRELLLARQVTHTNVVRIHDLGDIGGIKYITMPYIQGSDLWTILKSEGRLPVPRALVIARQVASGLVAAHEAGVVHRDRAGQHHARRARTMRASWTSGSRGPHRLAAVAR